MLKSAQSRQLKMKKQEFFYRPATVHDALGARKTSYASRNIAEKVAMLSEDECLIIPEIVPDGFESRLRFLKRGMQVVLDAGTMQSDAICRGITPKMAHKKAMSCLKPGQYCGLAWRSLRRNEWKRLSLDEAVKGTKLFAWTEITGNNIKAKPYNDCVDVGFYGGKFKFWVPSRTAKHQRYEITAESVPIKHSRFNHVIWTDICFTHYCGVVGNDFSFRYVKSEDFCAHEVAALEFLAKEEFRKEGYVSRGNRIPFDFLPFPIPTEETADYHKKLMCKVIVEHKEGKKTRKRLLNKAEREILLWDFVRIRGYEAAFGRKGKKITEYRWAA